MSKASLDTTANMTVKKMDCACDDGIPGSDLKLETGRSWFRTRFSTVESPALRTEPMAAQNASASCLQITTAPKRAATSHLLYNQQQQSFRNHKEIKVHACFCQGKNCMDILLRGRSYFYRTWSKFNYTNHHKVTKSHSVVPTRQTT